MAAFVGRERELSVLAELIGGGGPAAALISGEPGAGKSRLLAQAVALAPGARSFRISGYESEQQVPLAAAAGLFRSLAGIGPSGEALEALVFGLRSGAPDARARRTADTLEPLRIFEAACRSLASVQPALLLIDDLQWIDDFSFSLSHYLLRAAAESGQRLVVVAATRPAPHADKLHDKLPLVQTRRIQLGPLSRDEGRTLAQLLDPGLPTQAAELLWEEAGGVPFWVEVLALHGTAPEDIDELVGARLRDTSRETRKLFGALALAGIPMAAARVAELLDQPPNVVEAQLQSLLDRALLRRQEGEVRVAHDLLRSRAIEELEPNTRIQLHRRFAEVLERDSGEDVGRLRQALEHRRSGGLPIVELASRMARSPQRRLIGVDGLNELVALAEEADPLAADTVRLRSDLARLASELGEHERALAEWSLAADQADDDTERARALLEASHASYALGRTEEARELLLRSREVTLDDVLLALEQQSHDGAIYLWLEGRAGEGRALAREVATAAQRLIHEESASDDATKRARVRRVYMDALRLEYEAALQESDPDQALAAAEERERVAKTLSLEETLAAGLTVGVVLRQKGRVRQALTRFRRIRQQAERALLPQVTIDAGFWLGRTLGLVGELEEAEQVLVDTLSLARRVGDVPRGRYRVGRILSETWFQRGRLADAMALLEREIAEAKGDHQRIVLHGDRALWAARLDGRAAEQAVRAHLGAAEECAEATGCPRCTGELMLLSAEALTRIGAHEDAKRAFQRRVPLAVEGDELERLLGRHVSALLPADPLQRVGALEAALKEGEASPYRVIALWIRLDLGLALAAAGSERAIAVLKEAAALARASGAAMVAELAERSLREMGVRTWRRRASGAPLTDREREVAALVAEGATNREIAARLFLSPKTVEQHLVNLFRKLDVRNRTELAARLGELESVPERKNAGNP